MCDCLLVCAFGWLFVGVFVGWLVRSLVCSVFFLFFLFVCFFGWLLVCACLLVFYLIGSLFVCL